MACGYIHKAESGGKEISLYLENPSINLYSIKGYDFEEHKRLFWEQFESKAEAESFYSNACRSIGAINIWK